MGAFFAFLCDLDNCLTAGKRERGDMAGVSEGPQILGGPGHPLPVGGLHRGGQWGRGWWTRLRAVPWALPSGVGGELARALPRMALGKAVARTQVSSSSSSTPTRTLVTPMTRPCSWPVGLGGELGPSVVGSRIVSGDAERDSGMGTQGWGHSFLPRPLQVPRGLDHRPALTSLTQACMTLS